MSFHRINTLGCAGTCNQGRTECNCRPMPAEACSEFLTPLDPYQDELFPEFVRWIDEHPRASLVAGLFFVLLVLGIGGALDHGVF